MQTGLAQMERIPAALDGFVLELSNQMERLAKNNSRLKSINDRFVFEGEVPCGDGNVKKGQEGVIPKLQQYSELLANLLSEQENHIERIERFI